MTLFTNILIGLAGLAIVGIIIAVCEIVRTKPKTKSELEITAEEVAKKVLVDLETYPGYTWHRIRFEGYDKYSHPKLDYVLVTYWDEYIDDLMYVGGLEGLPIVQENYDIYDTFAKSRKKHKAEGNSKELQENLAKFLKSA